MGAGPSLGRILQASLQLSKSVPDSVVRIRLRRSSTCALVATNHPWFAQVPLRFLRGPHVPRTCRGLPGCPLALLVPTSTRKLSRRVRLRLPTWFSIEVPTRIIAATSGVWLASCVEYGGAYSEFPGLPDRLSIFYFLQFKLHRLDLERVLRSQIMLLAYICPQIIQLRNRAVSKLHMSW